MIPCTSVFPNLCLLFAALIAIPCAAAPLLHVSYSQSGSELSVSVVGTQFPALRMMSLTFAYDQTAVDPMNAVVSAPLAATAFGAILDTAARTIVLTIVATSSFTVADSATVTVVRAPAISGGALGQALSLTAALCVDTSGAQFSPGIESSAVSRPLHQGPRVASVMRARTRASLVMIDGRVCGARASVAAGVKIGPRNGGILIALRNAQRPEVH